jgi:hypothetical protein
MDEYRRQPHPESLESVIRFAFDGVHMVVAIIALPFELMVRWWMGSRYHHIVVIALAPLPPLAITVASVTGAKLLHSHALIGMGTVYAVMQLFLWLHYIHVFRVIAKPEREFLSREDGRPFPFWKYLPNGESWAMVRFIYEPGLLALAAVVLGLLHIFSAVVSVYFLVGAFALFVRTAFLYYFAWEYLRDILDQFNLSRRMAGGSNTSSSEEAIRRVIARAVANRPNNLPQGVINSVQHTMDASMPPELRKLIDDSNRPPADPDAL